MKALKESLIETYTSVVFSAKEAADTSLLDPYVGDIFQYLSLLSSDEHNNDLDFVKSIVGLLGDLTGLYGKKVQHLLGLPFVSQIIGILDRSTNKEHRKVARWTLNVITKSLHN